MKDNTSIWKLTNYKDSPKDILKDNIKPSHYNQGSIQPVDYIMANNLGFLEGNVIKYITRHEFKNGAEDIKKAIKYCEFILKYKYNEN